MEEKFIYEVRMTHKYLDWCHSAYLSDRKSAQRVMKDLKKKYSFSKIRIQRLNLLIEDEKSAFKYFEEIITGNYGMVPKEMEAERKCLEN